MTKIAVFLTCALLATGCASTGEEEAKPTVAEEVARQDDVIAAQRASMQRLKADNERLQGQVAERDLRIDALNERLAAASKLEGLAGDLERLQGELSKMGGDILAKPHAEGVAFEVAEVLLFNTGSSELKPAGRDVLQRLAAHLKTQPGQIRVEGHTDDVPVRKTAAQFPRGNLELSGERALTVADFLVKQAGLPATRISFAGYGEHRPAVPNSDDANRARNRRVEVVLLRGQKAPR